MEHKLWVEGEVILESIAARVVRNKLAKLLTLHKREN